MIQLPVPHGTVKVRPSVRRPSDLILKELWSEKDKIFSCATHIPHSFFGEQITQFYCERKYRIFWKTKHVDV